MKRESTIRIILLTTAFFLAAAPGAVADVEPVPRPCIVPETHAHIQEALDDAALGHCTDDLVTVRAGTYHELLLWPEVDGITLQGALEAEGTVFGPGLIEGSIITFGSMSGVAITEETVVRGIEFRNGFATSGGAIRATGASPTIDQCTFTECSAYNGGGIYSEAGSPVITDCVFEGNYGYESGGGIYALDGAARVSNCVLRNNVAEMYEGGGICVRNALAEIEGCTITANTSSLGGGIFVDSMLPATIVDNVISNNVASSGGGLTSFNSPIHLEGNQIFGNDGGDTGGALFL